MCCSMCGDEVVGSVHVLAIVVPFTGESYLWTCFSELNRLQTSLCVVIGILLLVFVIGWLMNALFL